MSTIKVLEALETIITHTIIWLRQDAIGVKERGDQESYTTYTSAAERLEKASELIGVAINILAQSQ